MTNPIHFFRQADADQFTGSMAYLDSQQSLFQRDQTSGLIEVQIDLVEGFILLFARGASTGTYHLTPGSCKAVTTGEIHSVYSNANASIFSLVLPDVAGRLAWLALESRLHATRTLHNEAEWLDWLEKRRAEKWTGLVQLASDAFDGLAYLQAGELVKSEGSFSTRLGFQTNPPFAHQPGAAVCELTQYDSAPASPAYQTFLLRSGMSNWTHRILNRYMDMVGQKLVQIMIDQSNLSIEPWQWQVQLEGTSLWDQHFFPSLETAAAAYRALLMSMGEQSSMMIGDGLTQRLISETYNQLRPEENKLLETQKLIPAAIT